MAGPYGVLCWALILLGFLLLGDSKGLEQLIIGRVVSGNENKIAL